MDLVTGVTGQDGGYLAAQLLAAGRRVVGLVMPGEALPPWVIELQAQGLGLSACDLADPSSFRHLLRELKPERVYHCAAVSVPRAAAADTRLSRLVNVTSVEVLCDWLRRDQHDARALVVSSSAVFASSPEPQDESSPSLPLSEYGRQKTEVRQLAAEARGRGLFAACAIPFNHESPRRSDDFVLPKLCRAAARISLGLQHAVELGALSPRRDWGYAPEYTQAMQWMLEVAQPLELVLATGEAHSVGELAELAFAAAGLPAAEYLRSSSELLRGDDQSISVGKPRRAFMELGWEARTQLAELVALMVKAARSEAHEG